MSDEEDLIGEPQYQPLKRRWYILVIFGLLGMLQAMIWDGWSTISSASFFAYPDWDPSTIALLGNWGEICYLAGVVPLTWLTQAKGARMSALVCAAMITIGSGIRCLQHFFLDSKKSGLIFKILAHSGAILNGTAGVVVCVVPSVISALWFPPGQRTTSTGLSWVLLELGNALGYLVGPLIVPDPPLGVMDGHGTSTTTSNNTLEEAKAYVKRQDMREDIMHLMYLHFGAALLLSLGIVVYFPSKPPVAPSVSSGMPRDDFRKGLRKLLRNRNTVFLVLAYSISQGVQEAIMPVLNLNIGQLGVKEDVVGQMGFWASVVSCAAALVSSHLADKMMGHFKTALLILLTIATLLFIWMTLICVSAIPFHLSHLYVAVTLGFAVNYACTPLFFELGSELAYPVGEGVVAGLMTCGWCIVGIIYLSVFFFPNIGYAWMNWSLVGSTLFSIPLLMLIEEEYHRTSADKNV